MLADGNGLISCPATKFLHYPWERSHCPAAAHITQLHRRSRSDGAQVTQNSSGLLPLEWPAMSPNNTLCAQSQKTGAGAGAACSNPIIPILLSQPAS